MLRAIRLLWALITSAGPALSCMCGNTGSPCDWLRTSNVFLGRVTVDSGEGRGIGPARLLVEEIVNGSYKVGDEITVRTSAGTSCYSRLIKDRRYVIFVGLEYKANLVSMSPCSSSFELEGNEALLNALRDAASGTVGKLVGKIELTKGAVGTSVDLGTVHVMASSANAQAETIAQIDGQFVFPPLPQGVYHLSVASVHVEETSPRSPEHDPILSSGVCGYQKLHIRRIDSAPVPGQKR